MTFRVNDAEKQACVELAQRLQISNGELVRRLLDAATGERALRAPTSSDWAHWEQLARLGNNINQLVHQLAALRGYVQQDAELRDDHVQRIEQAAHLLLPPLERLVGLLADLRTLLQEDLK